MGNCLVTKLKGVVDNTTLKKYGEWEFTLPSSGNEVKTMNGMYLHEPTMRIIGGTGYFCDAQGTDLGQEINTTGSNTFYYKSTTDLTIAVNGKYEHQGGEGLVNSAYHIHTDEIKYKQFVDFGVTVSGGPLSNIDVTRSAQLNAKGQIFSSSDLIDLLRNHCGRNVLINLLSSGTCNINTSRFSELSQYGLNTVEVRLYLWSGLSGELKNFGYFKVTDLYLDNNAAASMTGTLEDFIDLLLVNNPSGGKFKFAYPQRYMNVTYKGESLATQGEVLKQEQSFINYDAQGNITWTAS